MIDVACNDRVGLRARSDNRAAVHAGAVALLPAITETRLGAGAVGLGLLRAAYGLGAALVTLWLAFRPVRHRVGHRLLFAVATFGVATIVLGLTKDYWVAFGALMVLAAPTVLPHVSHRRRGVASGAIFAGGMAGSATCRR